MLLTAPASTFVVRPTSAAGAALSPDAFWSGLPQERPTATGPMVVLRPPRDGRVRIPGGVFVMGSTASQILDGTKLCQRELHGSLCEKTSQFQYEGLAHEVTISSFELDRTEVTVAAYARCVAAGVCAQAGYSPDDPRFARPELPVTYVRWDDARAYCEWAGGRLPTEAEWEYAARGTTSRVFPWGNVYNSRLTNHGSWSDDRTDGSDGFLNLAPVGSFPDGATPLGIQDLAGNAAEWVADAWSDPDDNGNGYPAKPQVNPKGPAFGALHVVRGGSYLDGAFQMRAAARRPLLLPRAQEVGFRCAADAR